MISGSKYGGYGTFLPTQARVPSVLADPHPAPPAAEVGRPMGEGVAAEVTEIIFILFVFLLLPFLNAGQLCSSVHVLPSDITNTQ